MTTQSTDEEQPDRDLELMTYEEPTEEELAAELAQEMRDSLEYAEDIRHLPNGTSILPQYLDVHEAAIPEGNEEISKTYEALAGYELDYDDPAEEVNAALARDQSEEYYARLFEEEIDGPEYVLELGLG